jgi:3-methyladenine DNA glycosylase AlkD
VPVPRLRDLVRQCGVLSLRETERLLASRIHEERLLALLLLVRRYDRGGPAERHRVYRFYLSHTRRVNNWDLVDLSAPNIVGAHLADQPRAALRRLARSPSLWERRIAMVATLSLIRRNEFREALAIAETLLGDGEDLIHKAAGWMLREVGKRNAAVLETFLRRHARRMPRTMLRYAIERFPARTRQRYLRRGG